MVRARPDASGGARVRAAGEVERVMEGRTIHS